MKIAACLALCLVIPLQAGSLEDLRMALGRMQGQGPLHGTYNVNTWSRGGKGKDIEESSGAASAWVEEGAAGLQIRLDRGLLKRAEDEIEAPKGAKKQDSPTSGIDAITVLKIHRAMNFAPKLARLLATGQLKRECAESYQGKPSRLLEIQLAASASGEKDPKGMTYTAKVWLGADGMPLGATLTKMMKTNLVFTSVDMTLTEEFVFSQVYNRLVVLRSEERMASKAMGVEGQQRTLATFTVK